MYLAFQDQIKVSQKGQVSKIYILSKPKHDTDFRIGISENPISRWDISVDRMHRDNGGMHIGRNHSMVERKQSYHC